MIIAAANDNVPIRDDPYSSVYMELAQRAEGFSVLVVSSTSYIDDRLLGSVGNYVLASEVDNVVPHFMTAPGFNLQYLGDKPLFGCSLATPCVAGIAAAILSTDKGLTHDQIKAALVNGGRKGGGDSIAITDEDRLRLIQAFQTTFGIQDIELGSTTRERYDQAIKQLEERQHNLEAFHRIIVDETLRYHLWVIKDSIKYRNHVDLAGALTYLANQARAKA